MTSSAVAVAFTAPPPGLHPLVDFALAQVDGASGLFTLRDTSGAGVRLFLLDPAVFVPDYAPTFTGEQLEPLDVEPGDNIDVFVVATIVDNGPVANLLAPIVVNTRTLLASQVILDGDDWPLHAQLAAAAA
jgi:flagellar assembly factor FliW